jgi:hypothetical protein
VAGTRKGNPLSDYVTKDSGQRESFGTGAVRDLRGGKGRYDLLSFLALDRIAGVYERGAAKYSDRNWEQGIPVSRNIDSALRHISQFMLGLEDEDHLAQAAWNLMAALHFHEGIKRGWYSEGLDDRPRYPNRFEGIPQEGPAPGTTAEAHRYAFDNLEDMKGAPPISAEDSFEERARKYDAIVHGEYSEEEEDYPTEVKEEILNQFAGLPYSPGVKATLEKIRESDAPYYWHGSGEVAHVRGCPCQPLPPVPESAYPPGATELPEAGTPLEEVKHSSVEQWHTPHVLHDRNHGESEGAWHYHPEGLEGIALATTPASEEALPHLHRKQAQGE